jgi:hypothetical protein
LRNALWKFDIRGRMDEMNTSHQGGYVPKYFLPFLLISSI